LFAAESETCDRAIYTASLYIAYKSIGPRPTTAGLAGERVPEEQIAITRQWLRVHVYRQPLRDKDRLALYNNVELLMDLNGSDLYVRRAQRSRTRRVIFQRFLVVNSLSVFFVSRRDRRFLRLTSRRKAENFSLSLSLSLSIRFPALVSSRDCPPRRQSPILIIDHRAPYVTSAQVGLHRHGASCTHACDAAACKHRPLEARIDVAYVFR